MTFFISPFIFKGIPMRRFFLSFFFLFFLTAPLAHAGAERYRFDKDHTTILFFVNHLGFSDKIGRFTDYEGTLLLDEAFPEKSSIQVDSAPVGGGIVIKMSAGFIFREWGQP